MSPTMPGSGGYEVHTILSSRGSFENLNYLVVDRETRQAALVDASWDIKGVAAKLEELGCELSSILLTHSHLDHVHMVPGLIEHFRPRIFISSAEADFYRFRCRGLETFDPMDRIEVGLLRFTCLETPGHTVGSACYMLPGAIFTGDTLFSEGCGICNAPGGCPHRMFHSLQQIKHVAEGGDSIFPGHSFWLKPGRKFSELLASNAYLRIENEALFVAYAMRKTRIQAAEKLRLQ